MIALLVFLFVSIVLAVEAISLWGNTRPLKVSFDVDTTLVEPDEIVTLRYSVSNPYPLPRLFVGFTLFFDPDVKVREDEAFCRSHVQASDMGARVDYRFFLGAHRAFTGKVRFSVSRRGLRELGRYFVETGEFLGLFPIVNSDPIDKKIVCTAEKCAVDELAFPGGELGDLSARRFILDDPTMLLGYREYTGREPMKQISWKQTAKVGRLMVRQNDYTTDRVAVVVVDVDGAQRQRMEECLKLVRTVIEQLEAAKVPYALMSNGDLLSLPEGIGREHLFFLLRRLGLSRLTRFNTFGSLVERCVRLKRSNCSYIVIAPAVGAERKAWIDYLGSRVESRPIVLVPDQA